jgi:hypothetical protein
MAKPYVSDVTTMIRKLLQDKPEIVEDQKKGRALWWDKAQDTDTQERNRESKVAQQAYVYQNKV